MCCLFFNTRRCSSIPRRKEGTVRSPNGCQRLFRIAHKPRHRPIGLGLCYNNKKRRRLGHSYILKDRAWQPPATRRLGVTRSAHHAPRSGNQATRSQATTHRGQATKHRGLRQPRTRRHVSRHAAASEGAHRMAMVQREQPVEDLETPGRPGTAVALQRSQEARREPPRSSAGRRASHGHGAAQAVVGRSRARGQLCAGRCLMSVPLNAALHLFSNSEPPRSCHTAAPRREIVLLLNGGMGLLLASPPRLSAPSWLHPRQAAAESNAA